MTHARQKGSLSQCRSEGRDHVGGGPHGEAMGGAWPEREGRTKKAAAKRGRPSKELKVGRDRKRYPLRRRGGAPEAEALSCHVLLTRLEEEEVLDPGSNLGTEGQSHVARKGEHRKRTASSKKAGKAREPGHTPPKTKLKPSLDQPQAPEPRKRRLASLNAEAVNSLLLEKADGASAAKLARKQQQEAPPGVEGAPATQQVRSGAPPRGHKSEPCQSPKQPKKTKPEEKDDSGPSLYTPTPRRLAGLNAAALLKLTSSSAGAKQRVKTDGKGACASGKQAPRLKSKVRQSKRQGWKQPSPQKGCAVCKQGSFESKLEWEGAIGSHRLTKPGYQSRSMLGYPLKAVKEEQVEAELRPYYCCSPPEGSVEYCHRLALFLGQQAYSEAEERPMTSVKRECLVPPPSLAHPALTLSAHPCLCADPCFSSYLVHIAHPGATSAALSARPLPYAPPTLCPGRVSGSKLLAPPSSHASGIPHPAFCSSVGSPCYSEACRVSSYAFSAVQPVASRGCSFTTGCSNCSQRIKTEGYPSPQGERSPSLLVPPALPLSGCPLPRVSPSTPAVPSLLSSLSDRRQAEVRLKVGRECPQTAKPPNGSLSMGRTRLSHKPPAPSPASAKQKKVSRRRPTNGWLPVGVPTEKDVFIAGEDETALRRCYEGVERDGEVIRVRDTVLLRSGPRKKTLPYVAKISALWDDPKTGELMMSLFWYYRPEHTQGGRDPSAHCENEIFASRHQDENSVACIEDRCYVLPLAQYCRFCALVKRRAESVPDSAPVVPSPCPSDSAIPSHRLVPTDVDPELVYLCRHVYDFRYGRILKNLQ